MSDANRYLAGLLTRPAEPQGPEPKREPKREWEMRFHRDEDDPAEGAWIVVLFEDGCESGSCAPSLFASWRGVTVSELFAEAGVEVDKA